MSTEHFNIPLISQGVTSFAQFNLNLETMVALASKFVISVADNSPSPAQSGDIFIVGLNPTGDFVGEENNIAVNVNGAWFFLQVSDRTEGLIVYNQQTKKELIWTGTVWEERPKVSTYKQLIGDDINSTFTINHNLNTRNVLIGIYQVAAPFAVITDFTVELTNLNNLEIDLGANIPTTDEYQLAIYAVD